MKICEIKDENKDILTGYLYYYENSETYIVELAPGLSYDTVPIFFDAFLQKGQLTVGPEWSRRFIEARVVPRDRQNLKSILREAGLQKYDMFKLLMLSKGRCSQDDCSIAPVSDIKDWMILRKKGWVTGAAALDDFRLYIQCQDNKSYIVDLKKILASSRTLKILLERPDDFAALKIRGNGRVISWGEKMTLLYTDLLTCAEELPFDPEDMKKIIKGTIVDVNDLCYISGTSRQYINKQLQKNNIKEFRKCGTSNLYLYSQVQILAEQ